MIGIKVLTPAGVVNISQEQIEVFLEKHKGQWFTSTQLAKELGLSTGSVSSNLKRAAIHRTIQKRGLEKEYTFEYCYLHQNEMIRNKPLPVKELKEVGE